MLCCALGLLAVLTGASARGLRTLMGAWPMAIIAGGSATALTILVPHHLEHYRQRAQAHDRTLLAEIVATPVCSGGQR
jgi:hypothetical protein